MVQGRQFVVVRSALWAYFQLLSIILCHLEFATGFAYAPNFITKTVEADLEKSQEEPVIITTRFPPEPNGYLHLGHAKAVCFNHAVARMHNGRFHLRMDDTNPCKEEKEYIDSIMEDVDWILDTKSPPWDGPVRKTSDYFELIYKCALSLVESGDAYVESLSPQEMREYRGSLTKPGRDSPYRSRSIEENLDMFQKMKDGEYANGEHILRAKINMASPNINMRDPALFRIITDTPHPETGTQWKIYPMYDFSHPISDAVEGITHSLCSLEFEDHRPLYDWTLEKLIGKGLIEEERSRRGNGNGVPRQIEFSRLNLKYTVLSKRKLIHLVKYNYVNGWSDPRMPTLSGIRRRGVPPAALKLFNERNGISKADSNIDVGVLEDCTREVMDKMSPRAFCIINPLKVTITNWEDENLLEDFVVPRHPKEDGMGERIIPFGMNLYIEREDLFDTEGPEGKANGGKVPIGFKRLIPGDMVRLKFAYVIKCHEIIRDAETDEPIELKCNYVPETRSGAPLPVPEDGSKAPRPGIIHWVEATTATICKVNQYDRLFKCESPGKSSTDSDESTTQIAYSKEDDEDDTDSDTLPSDEKAEEGAEEPSFLKDLNPNSLQMFHNCLVEPSVKADAIKLLQEIKKHEVSKRLRACNLSYQFERNGYFALDEASSEEELVFNRVVTLRDNWAVEPEKQENERARGKAGNKELSSISNEPVADVLRVAFRLARILSVEPHPTFPESLVVCKVDCGDDFPRTVVGKLPKNLIEDAILSKRPVLTVTNLKPAKIAGVESTAMLLAAVKGEGETETLSLLRPKESNVTAGTTLQVESFGVLQPDDMLKSKGAQKVWDRVKSALRVNSEGKVVFLSEQGKECDLKTVSDIPVTCELMDCVIQ